MHRVGDVDIISPTLRDIPDIQSLLKPEVERDNILYRGDDEVATNIRSYLIAKDGNKIVGVVALHIYTVELAEFRSMVVKKSYRGKGIGRLLIKKGLKVGRELGLKRILVLTYQKSFFKRLGFKEIEKMDIPNSKIWADCIKCNHFPVCEEVALIREI